MAGRWEKGNYRRGASDGGDNVICWVMLLGVARLGSEKLCAQRSVGAARDVARREPAGEPLRRIWRAGNLGVTCFRSTGSIYFADNRTTIYAVNIYRKQ